MTVKVRFLWYTNFYDYPLEGMCIAGNEELWFYVMSQRMGADIVYVAVRLTPEQKAAEYKWRELFRELVGISGEYDADGNCIKNTIKPNWENSGFWERKRAEKKPIDLSQNEIVGTFALRTMELRGERCERPGT